MFRRLGQLLSHASQPQLRQVRKQRQQINRRVWLEQLEDRSLMAVDLVPTGAFSIPESATNGTTVGTVAAVDVVTPIVTPISYSLLNNAGGRFSIAADTGVITVADQSQLNFEQFKSHTIQVQATYDAGSTYAEDFVVEVRNVTDQRIELISTGLAAADSNSHSFNTKTAVSGDGRYVVFQSDASNLVPGDTNNTTDIFRKDTMTGVTVRVSTDLLGVQANSASNSPSISADGRYVAFMSYATNFVFGDTNNHSDIFVKDLDTGAIFRVSVTATGTQPSQDSYEPVISADGLFVVFTSHAENLISGDNFFSNDIFRKDLTTQALEPVSVTAGGVKGNGDSFGTSISADGRYIAFSSTASNLTVAADTNGNYDVFRKDMVDGTVTLVSTTTAGVQGNGSSFNPSISADGQIIAFESSAENLGGGSDQGNGDIFRKDLTTQVLSQVNLTANGTQGDLLGFSSSATISADGRFVAFYGNNNQLVSSVTVDPSGSTHIYLKDTQTGAISVLDQNEAGTVANTGSQTPAISADGSVVSFSSYSNFVSVDTNGSLSDIYLAKNRQPGNHAPTVQDQTVIVTEDVTFTGGTLVGSDEDNQPLSYYLLNGNSNSEFNVYGPIGYLGFVSLNQNGTFRFTPAGNAYGTGTFTFVANDEIADSAVGTVTVTVNPVNDKPINFLQNREIQNTFEDTAFAFSVSEGNELSVGDNDRYTNVNVRPDIPVQVTLSVAHGTLTLGSTANVNFAFTTDANGAPAGDGTNDSLLRFRGLINDINAAIATVTYTPSPNYTGFDNLKIVTNDLGNVGSGGVKSDVDSLTIYVDSVDNDPPVTPAKSLNVAKNTSLSSVFAATDPEGDTLTYNVPAQPAFGLVSFDPATGNFTYTPGHNYVGSDSFNYTVTDGVNTTTGTVTVNVFNFNRAPITGGNGVASGTEDATIYGSVPAANDLDGDPLTYRFSSDPPAGVTLNADGTFSVVPTAADQAMHTGDSRIVTFDYSASDGTTSSATRIITVTINGVNDAPVLPPIGAQTATAGTLLTFTAAANDVDTPTASLTYGLAEGPQGATISSAGVFTWTPTADQAPGSYTFDVFVSDGNLTDSETITVTVAGVDNGTRVFEGEGTLLRHQVGVADGDGWSATPALHNAGFLAFGPYTTDIQPGANTATYRLQVNSIGGANVAVARIDVVDATAGTVLTAKTINLSEFTAANSYQDFTQTFTAVTGHRYEFRTYWFDNVFVKLDKVTVVPTSAPPSTMFTFEGESDFFHQTGFVSADSWSAVPANHNAGFLAFGPYTQSVAPGTSQATFRLKASVVTGSLTTVARIDVVDSTVGAVLTNQTLLSSDFTAANTYQDFPLVFEAAAGHSLEFRTYWFDNVATDLDKVTVTPVSGSPLLLDSGAAHACTTAAELTASELAATVTAAIDRLVEDGIDVSSLRTLPVEVANLPDGLLGYHDEVNRRILIDDDAAGSGWYIDPTPATDEEFDAKGNLIAAGSNSQYQVDLLTAVLHEMGHELGLSHSADEDNVMSATLPVGKRRTF